MTSPAQGALLDLKENTTNLDDGVTASKGLGLPRVELQANSGDLGKSLSASTTTDETLDKDEHIGLLVYNTAKDESSEATRLCPGLHVWDGNKWQPIVPYPVIKPTKTVVAVEVTAESGREDVTGTPGYEVGPLGQFIDTRGPEGVEVNKYHYARFYAYKVNVSEGFVTYKGVRNPNTCDPTKAIEETWTEHAPFEYIDDGIWMTENMNTKYLTPTATNPITLNTTARPDVTYKMPLYTPPANAEVAPADKTQDGLLYNWAAATNQKGGSTGWENIDNPNEFEEEHILHKKRQGICPDGWYLPSDKEWNELEAVIAASGNTDYTNTAATSYTWTTNDNTTASLRGTTHGRSMTSIRSLGDSKPASEGGFNAIFTGNTSNVASSYSYGDVVYFWSSSSSDFSDSEGADSGWGRTIFKGITQVYRMKWDRANLFSVRCRK